MFPISRALLARVSTFALFAFLATQSAVSVAGALTTDDTDMLGKDKWQFELSTEFSTFVTSRENVWTPELSYGLSDSVYIFINFPSQHLRPDGEPSARGINDPSFNLKWRFYERGGLSFAFAPSITAPLANEEEGLGNGRATYRAIGLMQYETGAFTWLLNAGYIRNNNVNGDRRNLWSASAGMYYQLNPQTKLGFDYGYNSNNDPNITQLEHFAGIGAVYSPNDQLDFTLGYKRGFNRDSLDHSWITSVVVHF